MAAYYKSKGMSLVDLMNSLYEKYGMYLNTLLNFNFEGASGMQKMADMMTSLRENAPKEIAGQKVVTVADYKKSEKVNVETGEKTVIDLPKSNVLSYSLPDGSGAIVRPSGTEPKIKIYITAVAPDRATAQKKAEKIGESMKKILGV
jgi:phosphoglucomutase